MISPQTQAVSAEFVSIDSSLLFNIARNLDPITDKISDEHLEDHELLDFYVSMCELVEAGKLTFPRRVLGEAEQGDYQDLAIAFAAKSWRMLNPKLKQPREEHLRLVLKSETAIKAGWAMADNSDADPYVIALGMTLSKQTGIPCAVATRDREMIRCCKDFDMQVLDTPDFVRWVRQRQAQT